MVFCRTELFTTKFPICGSTLLLTQWERKKDAAEYFADLAEETLGGELWRRRLEATVADGEETLVEEEEEVPIQFHFLSVSTMMSHNGCLNASIHLKPLCPSVYTP